jgi:hypothetical protein
VNTKLRRAIEAVGHARVAGKIFDDEIARAVIEALREPGAPTSGIHPYLRPRDEQWNAMIDIILQEG